MCSDVSRTTWKNSVLKQSHPLQNYFLEKYKNRTIITQSAIIVTPSNLWFLGEFENYLFFIIILAIISEKHHFIKQLPW